MMIDRGGSSEELVYFSDSIGVVWVVLLKHSAEADYR